MWLRRYESIFAHSFTQLIVFQIYSFLIKFPVYKVLLTNFNDEAISYKEVFPPGQPFKSLYAVYALREYIRTHIQVKGAFNEGALTRATKLVVSAISDPELLNRCSEGELRDNLALNLIDSLLVFLKGKVMSPFV